MPFFGQNLDTRASFAFDWVGDETFVLREQFRYRYEKTGDIFIVPREIGRFTTDFASVPTPLTWLIPRVGNHVPAAVLHDALLAAPGEPTDHIGREVSRDEADEIFHAAMTELGVPFIRKWLMLLGVGAATAFSRWWSRVFLLLMSTVLVALFLLSLLDLFDTAEILPWMGASPWPVELLTGLAVLIGWVLVGVAVARRHRQLVLVGGLFVVCLLPALVLIQATIAVYYLLEATVRQFVPPPVDERPMVLESPATSSTSPPQRSATGSVFVSYSRADDDRVESLVRTIEAETGADVWWDFKLEPGDDWNAEILASLEEADCIVVFWSKTAVESDWVKFEAYEALKRGVYVPAALDPVVLTADLDRHRANLYDDRNRERLGQLMTKIRATLP